jgi:Dyp-type peroxidase family
MRYTRPPAAPGDGHGGLLRSEAHQRAEKRAAPPGAPSGHARSPVNIAFTYQGLAALRLIDAQVLASFPEAFRQGMAARARLLRDVGPSAPEHWDGALGKSTVHGLLTAYFPVTEPGFRYWDTLRRQAEEFNEGSEALRGALTLLFQGLGFEVLHVEFGQNPYRLAGQPGNETIQWPEHRVEHFGFRDGISQPFVDLGLKTPLPGGGRPAKDGTWAPVAPGEIFLGARDEDGHTADQPINALLRDGATYLVFRKLEQDVAGLRSFLASQRPTPEARTRLAAQIVGRWPSGAPLVRHPQGDASYQGARLERSINDFRYLAEDPHGRKCPIGSHVRRVNPRDTGGRDDVKRHRILRRSLAYGGPLLAADSLGDGRQRGLLFMAANARIELQFEVIQRDWINGGEFLGQVGAGGCPLTGSKEGTGQDWFLEAGAVAPICGIPSFVLNRGGDYFFVPSIRALEGLARGEAFTPDQGVPFGPFSAARAETPSLLNEGRLKAYAMEILTSLAPHAPPGLRNAIRVRLPKPLRSHGPDAPAQSMVFVGRYDDVVEVLGGCQPGRCPASGEAPAGSSFSVAHNLQAGREITRGASASCARPGRRSRPGPASPATPSATPSARPPTRSSTASPRPGRSTCCRTWPSSSPTGCSRGSSACRVPTASASWWWPCRSPSATSPSCPPTGCASATPPGWSRATSPRRCGRASPSPR